MKINVPLRTTNGKWMDDSKCYPTYTFKLPYGSFIQRAITRCKIWFIKRWMNETTFRFRIMYTGPRFNGSFSTRKRDATFIRLYIETRPCVSLHCKLYKSQRFPRYDNNNVISI